MDSMRPCGARAISQRRAGRGAEQQHAVGPRRGGARMRHQHAGRALVAHLRDERVEHALGGGRVEVAGRLVGQDQARPVHQRARDRDALQLAARELLRQALGQALAGRPRRASPRPARASSRPSSSSGSATLSCTLRCGSTWKAWNTKPSFSRRSRACAGSGSACTSLAVEQHAAGVDGSSPAMQFSSVDLPTPDSPSSATNSPACTCSETLLEDRHHAAVAGVALGDGFDSKQRCHRCTLRPAAGPASGSVRTWAARRARVTARPAEQPARERGHLRRRIRGVGRHHVAPWHRAQPGELALGELAGGGDAGLAQRRQVGRVAASSCSQTWR